VRASQKRKREKSHHRRASCVLVLQRRRRGSLWLSRGFSFDGVGGSSQLLWRGRKERERERGPHSSMLENVNLLLVCWDSSHVCLTTVLGLTTVKGQTAPKKLPIRVHNNQRNRTWGEGEGGRRLSSVRVRFLEKKRERQEGKGADRVAGLSPRGATTTTTAATT